jgi:radical SAM-linked protein
VSEETLQRMRVTFGVGQAIKYISHLDLLRSWERAFRRARVPLAYSHGYNPHPRLVIAMPLPVGCTGEREVVDVYLTQATGAPDLLEALAPAMPPGLAAHSAREVPLRGPALPSVIVHAVYRVELVETDLALVRRETAAFLRCERSEVTFRRKTFDLRPLVGSVDVSAEGDTVVLCVTLLRVPSGRIGRPDVFLEELGLAPFARRIHRLEIAFNEVDGG